MEWNPGMLLGVSGGYWRGCAVQAAVRLRVFTELGDKCCKAEEVATAVGADKRAMSLLLDALSAMGLLEKSNELYTNSSFAGEFLIADRPKYMGHIVLHHHQILDGWAQLDQAVLTGESVQRRSFGEEVERESFLMGMFNLAMIIAPQICAKLKLDGRKKLLDLGGGPGTYAIHFCLNNPELKATIFDRPTTEPFARETVATFNLSDRIDFIGGDFTHQPMDMDIGGPYDVAWLSHILHSNSWSDCQSCLEKTVAALAPGGKILVHDFILNDNKDGPEFPALFALNMLLGTKGGRSYSRAEITKMLEDVGITEIEHLHPGLPNDSSIISGVKQGV